MSKCTVKINVTNVSGLSTYALTISNIEYTNGDNSIYFYYPGTNSWIDYSDGGSTSYTFSASSPFYALVFANDVTSSAVPFFMKTFNNSLSYLTATSGVWASMIPPTSSRGFTSDTDNYPLYVNNLSSNNIPITFYLRTTTSTPYTIEPGETQRVQYYPNTSSSVIIEAGSPSYTVTAQNTQNMKQIQVGSTVYNTFPASIPITGNTTLQCSGEDDKTITVNYTNTSVPVITDTQ